MTTVYIAYHSFNLSRTAAFLASDECKSFKDFQRIRARQCSFRQFCQLLANDLTVEVASSLNYNASSSDDEDDERMTNDEASVQEVIVHNKREAFFSKPKLVIKGEVEELLMFHVLLESKPVVSGVVVWTIHQVFKSIADMAGKQPGYVLPAMSLYAK